MISNEIHMLYCIIDNLKVKPEDLYRILKPKFDNIYVNKYCVKTRKWELNISNNDGTWVLECLDSKFEEIFHEMVTVGKLVQEKYSAQMQMEMLDIDGKITKQYHIK